MRSKTIVKCLLARRLRVSIAVLAAAFFSGGGAFASASVDQLRCEFLENPPGIGAQHPGLSWVIHSDAPGRGQGMCQILVASSLEQLDMDDGDLWDSGKISLAQSVPVSYAGKPLASREKCFWKVRVWDSGGDASAWSEPAQWTMGLLDATDWHAKWIGLDEPAPATWLEDQYPGFLGSTTRLSWIWFPAGEPEKSAPPGTVYFRRVIVIPTNKPPVQEAHFQFAGDSECRAWINGFDLGVQKGFRAVKDADVTYHVGPGTNVLCLAGINSGSSPKPAGVAAMVRFDFIKGDTFYYWTDEQWKVSGKAEKGWNGLNFDDSKWVAAKTLGQVGMPPWGNVRTPESRRLPARYLRKDFLIVKEVARATVYFSGLGWSELYLNGGKVGDAVLSPVQTDYARRVFYMTYDVTQKLRSGTNALGAVLGNGTYYAPRSEVYPHTVSDGCPKCGCNCLWIIRTARWTKWSAMIPGNSPPKARFAPTMNTTARNTTRTTI